MWYIFRHGETFANKKQDMVMGHTKGIFLTFDGILQTHLNGLKLLKTGEDFHNYKFICSPLERTVHTCQLLLNELNLEFNNITIDYLLEEKSKGLFDGIKKVEIKKQYSKELEILENNKWSFVPCNGYENDKVIFLKLIDFYEKYKDLENVVIVSHEGICRKLIYMLQNISKINNFKEWIENLSDDDGTNIIREIRKEKFNQNYFYSWDGEELVKI